MKRLPGESCGRDSHSSNGDGELSLGSRSRNSNSGEKSIPKARRHAEVESCGVGPVSKLPKQAKTTGAGMNLDKMMADARSRDFHPVTLPA